MYIIYIHHIDKSVMPWLFNHLLTGMRSQDVKVAPQTNYIWNIFELQSCRFGHVLKMFLAALGFLALGSMSVFQWMFLVGNMYIYICIYDII